MYAVVITGNMAAFFTVMNRLAALGLLILLGFLITKKKLMPESFSQNIVNFISGIIIPIFAVMSLQMDFNAEMALKGGLVFLLFIGGTIIGIPIGLISGKLCKIPRERFGMWTYSAMFSNCIFMGFPVLEAVFGEEVLFYLTMINSAANISQFTIGISIIAKYGSKDSKQSVISWKKMIFSPVNCAIVLGLILFFAQIRLPNAIATAGDMISSTMTPLALVYIGTMLAGNSLKELLGDYQVYVLSFLRLIFIPAIFYLLLAPWIKDDLILGPIVLGLGAMPGPAMGALFVGQYGGDGKFASKFVVLSTLFSAVTIPIACLLFI